MPTILKISSLFAVLFIVFGSLTSVHAQTDLRQAFNFFNVPCLVPDAKRTVGRGEAYTGFDANGARVTFGAANTGLGYSVPPCANISNGLRLSLLDQAVIFLSQLGPILAVLVVIWAGYLYYNSVFGGSEETAAKAIRSAVTGLAIILLTPVLYRVIISLNNPALNTSSTGFFNNFIAILVGQIIQPLANAGIVLGAAMAVVSFVYAGYQYILNDATKGAKALQNAFVGLLVVLGSVALAALTQTIYNFIFPNN